LKVAEYLARIGEEVMPKSAKKVERLLVLCVDRDDDLGVKGGIKTPVLGREENIKAATTLILRDPEEADANAMFEAIRIYDRLNEEVTDTNGKCQIATITGSELGGVGADRKLVSELTGVLKEFPASDVVLVTDGYGDEAVLPLVESRVPVTSVRRLVITHNKSVEETVTLFFRYLKILFENPRYSRVLIGLPGLLLIVLAILYAQGWLFYTWIAFLIVLGAFFFVKGFGIDKMARDLHKWISEYSPPPFSVQIAGFSTIAGVLLVAIASYLGAFEVNSYLIQNPPPDLGQLLAILPRLVGAFISGAIALIVIGICVFLSGRVTLWFFERDPKLWRTIASMVAAACSYPIFHEASQILINPSLEYTNLVIAIIASIVLTVTAVLTTNLLHRKYAKVFAGKNVKK
jgi:putative membrane protein